MARNSSTKNGSSKIRFIMLEAELNEGDLSQVTQAIQNALKSSHSQTRVIQSLPKSEHPIDSEVAGADSDEEIELSVDEPIRKSRPTKPRSIKPPKVVEGVDWDKKVSLKDFVEGYDLKTDFERYLVIALWFRDERETSAIGPSEVYTAYRHLNWSTSIPDFAKPFRNMVQNQLFTGGAKEGFAINQLGEGKVKAKKRA